MTEALSAKAEAEAAAAAADIADRLQEVLHICTGTRCMYMGADFHTTNRFFLGTRVQSAQSFAI